ncbi:MAG: DNA topoisomerase VI subunit B [Nanoarchaeota archaeon]|nr:DNA topoisomerase VI subunit B [Nanoarchaeota archaeon]
MASVENGSEKIRAIELAGKQREIGVAEFFARNRHLLGFDNKRKALMTTIKEAVDNSLDACEEADILPELSVEVIEMGEDRFRVIVEDNGPGIVEKQIPKIFAKLLYGSKFHRLKMSRGQQGIGISASVMYSQLTTGRAAKITSKISPKHPAHYYELKLNTQTNQPEIITNKEVDWPKDHGTKIELDLEASYQGGHQSIDEYLKETAIVNPHTTIIYTNPKAEQIIFPRAVHELPPQPKEIKPHPYGVELGLMMQMLKDTEYRTLQAFLMNEFSRVGSNTVKQICENASILPTTKPKAVSREMAEKLMQGISKTKIMAPPTDCITPIGCEAIEKGLKKEINAEFYASSTRPPNVYRGNPFVIEAGIAYGGNQTGDKSIRVMRFANRVPLLFQPGSCAITKSIQNTSWRAYGLSQSSGALPIGPCTILVHVASVWVPFTSESKEAIAHYPEIIKEIKLALQECGRKLSSYVGKKKRVKDELKKRSYIERYIPHMVIGLKEILNFGKAEEEETEKILFNMLEKHRGTLENMEFDASKNVEFDETMAKIGSRVSVEDELFADESKKEDNKESHKEEKPVDKSKEAKKPKKLEKQTKLVKENKKK